MRIDILKDGGFCGGVNKALSLLDKALREYKNETIHLLGPIVHNDIVNNKYIEKGVKIIDFADLETLNDNDIVFISAHGLSDKKRELLKRFRIIDTTCPFVRKNQILIKNTSLKEIIFIGKENHSETLALTEDNKNIWLINDINKLNDFSSYNEGVVYNQTTYNSKKLNEFHNAIKEKAPNYKIKNTLCENTKNIQSFLLDETKYDKYSALVVVGDKTSNNANSLFNMSPYERTYFISNLDDVKNIRLSLYDNVIIIGSASTPKDLLLLVKEEIIKNLDYITRIEK